MGGMINCVLSTLVSLHPRINLSPFTKDFRGEEHDNESIDIFFELHFWVKQSFNQVQDVSCSLLRYSVLSYCASIIGTSAKLNSQCGCIRMI